MSFSYRAVGAGAPIRSGTSSPPGEILHAWSGDHTLARILTVELSQQGIELRMSLPQGNGPLEEALGRDGEELRRIRGRVRIERRLHAVLEVADQLLEGLARDAAPGL